MEFVPGKFNQPECRVADGRALSDLVDEQNASRGEAPAATPEMDRLVRTIWRLRQADRLAPGIASRPTSSITKNMVEEAYEAVDAIEGERRRVTVCEELGDVLEQVLLHARIAADAGEFAVCGRGPPASTGEARPQAPARLRRPRGSLGRPGARRL